MTNRRLAIAAAGVLVASVFAGYLRQPEAIRQGQLVFLVGAPGESNQFDAEVGSVVILACTSDAEGLRVSGHVDASGELVSILVSPGDPTTAGRAVSVGFAESAALLPAAVAGDFRITLPWATRSSTFTVADANSFLAGYDQIRVSRQAVCPEPTTSE